MHVHYMGGKPRLLLFAITDITANTEIRYNYDAPGLWWRRDFPQFNKPFFVKDLDVGVEESLEETGCSSPDYTETHRGLPDYTSQIPCKTLDEHTGEKVVLFF